VLPVAGIALALALMTQFPPLAYAIGGGVVAARRPR
jgi:hypothetical protein